MDWFWVLFGLGCLSLPMWWLIRKIYFAHLVSAGLMDNDDYNPSDDIPSSADGLWDACKICMATEPKHNCKKCKHKYALMAEKIEERSKR